MSEQRTPPKLAPLSDETRLKRVLLAWANRCPQKPEGMLIQYESLPPDGTGIGIFSERGAYVEEGYIGGGYRGAYDFTLAYRIQPEGSTDARLAADEQLDSIAGWLCAGPYPDLGSKANITHVDCVTRAAVSGEDQENGVEDHITQLKITYERESENPWLI